MKYNLSYLVLYVMRLLFLLVLIPLGFSACRPFKVTDPQDSRFDPLKFEFYDYRTHEEFAEFAQIHLPLGTDRSYVEKILVENAGAVAKELDPYGRKFGFKDVQSSYEKLLPENVVNYSYPGRNPKFLWNVTGCYDSRGKLIQIFAYNVVVFPKEK